MAVVLILGYFTVGILLSSAHGIGLFGSLGGIGADLNIGLGSRQSSAGNSYGGYKHGDIGGDFGAGIGGSSSLSIASASSLSSNGGFGGEGSGSATGGYAGGGTANGAFGHSNTRTESSGLGLKLGLGIGSGALGNSRGHENTFGHHKGSLGLLDVGIGIIGSAESLSSSSAGATASAVNNIGSESNHFAGGSLSNSAPSSAGGSLDTDITGGVKSGYSASSSLSGSSTADVAGSLAVNIEGSPSGVKEGDISSNREVSSSSHISSSGSASHKLVGNSHEHGSSSSSGLLGVIASTIDSDRKREHSFKHSSGGSTSLQGSFNAGSGSAGSKTRTSLSDEKRSPDTSDESSSGIRSTIKIDDHKHGLSGNPIKSYTGSSSWSKESSFSTSLSAAQSEHASSSGSVVTSLSGSAGSHDSVLGVGFGGSLSGSSHSDRPTVVAKSHKNNHGHSIGIGGAVGIGAAGSAGASSNSGFKVSKHEIDHNLQAGLSGGSDLSASVDSSKTIGGSKVISGSYGESGSSGLINSNGANIAENFNIKAGLGSSIGAGNSAHSLIGSGSKRVITSEGAFSGGLKAESAAGSSNQNSNSLSGASLSNDVSYEASNSGRVTNSKTTIGASAADGNSVGHSVLSKESLGTAHSLDAGAKIGVGIGLGLLGSKSIGLIDSPDLGGSLSANTGSSIVKSSDAAGVGIVKGSSPTISTSFLSAGSSGTLASGSLNAEKQIGAGIGLGLSGTSGGVLLDSSSSFGSKSEILKASKDTKVISSANTGASSIISDGTSAGLDANARGDVGSAVIYSKGVLGSSSSIAGDISGEVGIHSSSKKGGHGTRLSTSYSAAGIGGGQSSGSSGILSPIGGLIGGIHKSVHVSTGGYGGTSSINTSHDRNIVTKSSAESTGILGGLLGAHASVGSYSSSGGNSQPLEGYGSSDIYGDSGSSTLEGYSTGHRGSFRGNLNSGASASASSSSSYGSISSGLGLALGR